MCYLLIKLGGFVVGWMILFKRRWLVNVKWRDVLYSMLKYNNFFFIVLLIVWIKIEDLWL